ncbi:uncharacterized protein LOC131649265 [Vicia villosa]|uniref:uncharacterized protein LOC131649265 n=1 Tax=Vicia villosa TaxID=3911 RepID=UPI00273BFD87|nr:uncharacterized protein LOC131649265 [Vicia villosa]
MGSSRGRGRPPKKVTQSTGSKHGGDAFTPATTTPVSTATLEENVTAIAEAILDKKVTGSDGKGTSEAVSKVEEPVKAKVIGESSKLWVDVISGNRQTTNGKQLQYVAPKINDGIIEVEIEEKDVESEIRFWENSLIMYVIGTNVSMNAMKNYMSRVWNFVALPDMYYNDEGYFILKFKNGDARDEVMMKGPYTFQNKPMILLEWRPDFTMAKDMLKSIPIWIKLPNLPLPMWGAPSLGKIGSAVGIPLFTDECTAEKLRVSYARLLVEVDVTQKLCEEITIRDHEGKIRKQQVEYEWRPQYCERCQKIGHVCSNEKKPTTKIWQQKTKKNDEVIEKNIPVNVEKEDEMENEDKEEQDQENQGKGTWTEVKRKKDDEKKHIGGIAGTRNREISSRLSKLRPDIAILVETRVKQDKAVHIRKMMGGSWNYLDNYKKHANGRVWIMWDKCKVDIKGICDSDQMIHCGVFDITSNFQHWLTAIYADNKLERRRILWKDIEKIHSTQQGPWCLIGDYNNVLTTDDRIGGKEIHEGEYSDLATMMTNCGLAELDKIGDRYTWCNKHVNGTIYSCIDRAIANNDWFQQRLKWELHVLEPSISDHALLCLRNNEHTQRTKSMFKFLNKVTEVHDYREQVERNWNRGGRGTSQGNLWDKLKRLQPTIKRLSKPFKGISMQIDKARKDLEDTQKHIVNDRGNKELTKEEKQKTESLLELLAIDEQIMRQRAKVSWIRLGDGNNAYFHATLKSKQSNMRIHSLHAEDGRVITDHNDITEEVIHFYRKLMGTAHNNLEAVDIQVLRKGKQLSNSCRLDLIKEITEAEIVAALKSIGDLKAPGVDGYNSKFFKASWGTVKGDVTQVVRDFFERGEMDNYS